MCSIGFCTGVFGPGATLVGCGKSVSNAAGHLGLGLNQLPATDSRVYSRGIARYRTAIAVRSDDPLATRDIVRIEDLAGREIAVDFGAANPFVLSNTIRRLNAKAVTKVVRASVAGRRSEIEVAAQARVRRLVVMIAYAPSPTLGRVFSPPDFTLVPIDESTWQGGELAIAWFAEGERTVPNSTLPSANSRALSAPTTPVTRRPTVQTRHSGHAASAA